jgi:opacity protein-like surface antigen
MSRTIGVCVLLAGIAVAGSAAPAYAQRTAPAFGFGDEPKQTISVTFGGLALTKIDDRDPDDVIVANLDFLEFDPDELTKGSWLVGAEWLIPLGSYVEAGAGIAVSGRRESASVYRDFVEVGTLDEIEQDLSLRVTPLSFTIRAVPFGQGSPVQPYVGAGLGLFGYKYTEAGEFLDFSFDPPEIFVDTFEATGWQPGLIVLGGLRWAADSASVGAEFRYHQVKADLDTEFFVAPEIDLGGWVFQITLGGRF